MFSFLNLAWKSQESFVLTFCECFKLNENAYLECKVIQGSLKYIAEMYTSTLGL
jgi:hypothetical protein